MKNIVIFFVKKIIILAIGRIKSFGFYKKKIIISNKSYSFVQKYNVTSVNLKISSFQGNIETSGHDENTIEILYIVRKQNKVLDLTLDQLKNLVEIEIHYDYSNLEINIRRTFERSLSVSFKINTPIKSKCSLNTRSGNINLTRVNGNAIISTDGGNISLSEIIGDVNVSTLGGNISLTNIDGKLKVYNSGGNIIADSIKRGLIGHTNGGNIQLKDIKCGLDVKTSGGSISLMRISGTVKAITNGGNISVDIIKLTDLLELRTNGGNIDVVLPRDEGLDLDLSADFISTTLSDFMGIVKKNRINGKIKGGGVIVYITTLGVFLTMKFRE